MGAKDRFHQLRTKVSIKGLRPRAETAPAAVPSLPAGIHSCPAESAPVSPSHGGDVSAAAEMAPPPRPPRHHPVPVANVFTEFSVRSAHRAINDGEVSPTSPFHDPSPAITSPVGSPFFPPGWQPSDWAQPTDWSRHGQDWPHPDPLRCSPVTTANRVAPHTHLPPRTQSEPVIEATRPGPLLPLHPLQTAPSAPAIKQPAKLQKSIAPKRSIKDLRLFKKKQAPAPPSATPGRSGSEASVGSPRQDSYDVAEPASRPREGSHRGSFPAPPPPPPRAAPAVPVTPAPRPLDSVEIPSARMGRFSQVFDPPTPSMTVDAIVAANIDAHNRAAAQLDALTSRRGPRFAPRAAPRVANMQAMPWNSGAEESDSDEA